jgi:large subunit ribosomal protein L23
MAEKTIKTNIDAVKDLASRVLIEPWITENATAMLELNKYVFKIAPKATKKEVKKAVEDLYKVKVIAVNTVKIPRKSKTQGRTQGWKSGFKKAIITLKEGDKIEFFEGK